MIERAIANEFKLLAVRTTHSSVLIICGARLQPRKIGDGVLAIPKDGGLVTATKARV
jgi:hypothetical protein